MLNKKLFLKSTLIITLATLLSKVLGLARQQYSIYLFGGGWEFDAFIAAFRIPNALRELLAEGALSAAFIPLFSAILARGDKKGAFQFANKILNISLLLTITVTAIGFISANSLMEIYHQNPQHYPEATLLAGELFNIMLFFLPFMSLSALMMGMLNSMNQFTISALGPFFSNISFLVILVVAHHYLGIHALGYATVAGGMTYFAIQVPSLIKSGFRFRFTFDFKDQKVKEFFLLFVPFALAMGVPKLNNILSNIYSDEMTGGNTALSQGFFIIQLPLSVFVAGISMVSLPNMAKFFENHDIASLKKLMFMGLKMVCFFTFPSVIGLMFLDFEIARFIYSDVLQLFSGGDRGRIDSLVIENISHAQLYFAPGVISMGVSIIFIRAFQSMKDMRILIYTGLTSVFLHLLLMTFLVKSLGWGFEGIALSITFSSFFNLGLLITIFIKKVGSIYDSSTLLSIAKMGLAALVMGTSIMLFKIVLINWIPFTPYVSHIITTTVMIITGIVTYVITLLILKEEELYKIWTQLLKRILPNKK